MSEKKWTQKQKPTGRKKLTNVQKLERIVDMEIDNLYKRKVEHDKGKGSALTNDEVSRLERLIKAQAGMDERKKVLDTFEAEAEADAEQMTPEQIRSMYNELRKRVDSGTDPK